MKILLQAIKSLLRKVESTAERVLSFFDEGGIIKRKHMPDGYPYSEFAEILPSITAVDDGTTVVGMLPIYAPFKLTIGNEYIVTYNGKDYTCIAQEGGFDSGTLYSILLGNASVLSGTDTGEPFAVLNLVVPEDGLYGGVVSLDGSASATIRIVGNEIVKMDARYLPDPILSSPNGTRYKITVDDDGTLSAIAITE